MGKDFSSRQDENADVALERLTACVAASGGHFKHLQ